MSANVPLSRTAVLICDLQNDFIDPKGAYGRAGVTTEEIAAVPRRVKPLTELLRAKGGFSISTHFTLVPGRGGEPLISPHLKAMRPFLAKGDTVERHWLRVNGLHFADYFDDHPALRSGLVT